MRDRTASRIAWSLWGAAIALSMVALVFLIASWEIPAPPELFGPRGFSVLLSMVLPTVGAIVASRQPRNPIGWTFAVAGVLSGVSAVASEYSIWAVLEHGDRGALQAWALWIAEWFWIPVVGSLGFVFAVFPDGRTLSPRWRRALVVAIAGTSLATVSSALLPQLNQVTPFRNPIGVSGEAIEVVGNVGLLLFLGLIALGLTSLVVRFRRSTGDERQQVKWVALAASTMLASLLVFVALSGSDGLTSENTGADWAENLVILGFFSIPAAIGIGVLKYRLYDIDVVINRAIVYGGLALFITVVYVAIVVGVGSAIGSRSNAFLSAVAAAVVALAFQPLRRRAQHLANRLVYGKRATPYEVLSELSSRFAGTYSLEDALPRLATVTAAAVGARSGRVWLRHDGELRAAASWPPGYPDGTVRVTGEDLPPLDEGEFAFPVRHQGRLLGAISVTMPPNEPPTPAQSQLVTDVAAQAGLVLRNVALVQDLRESRQRLVAAQDEERRRIERDLHDGAQQQLVALSVKLRLAEQVAEADPDRARAMIAEVRQEAGEALENLRDLARGIYPPLLADEGLRSALESHARKVAVWTLVEFDGIGRYPREIESAVYFCVLEALQNVSKYAQANRVIVRLAETNGDLRFSVEDDGVGFDAASARGTGLTNMRDRLEALGGTLAVHSTPGGGTTVSGQVSVRDRKTVL